LASLGVGYHDAFDPRVRRIDCEFKDPHHGGNAMFVKML